jgi:hypothetical protein
MKPAQLLTGSLRRKPLPLLGHTQGWMRDDALCVHPVRGISHLQAAASQLLPQYGTAMACAHSSGAAAIQWNGSCKCSSGQHSTCTAANDWLEALQAAMLKPACRNTLHQPGWLWLVKCRRQKAFCCTCWINRASSGTAQATFYHSSLHQADSRGSCSPDELGADLHRGFRCSVEDMVNRVEQQMPAAASSAHNCFESCLEATSV